MTQLLAYGALLPTLAYITAVFGATFCVVALALHWLLGSGSLWRWWAVYVPALGAACIWKLSGLVQGYVDLRRLVYYVILALVTIGLPAVVSGLVIRREAPALGDPRKEPGRWGIVLLRSWASGLAVTPVVLVAIALADWWYGLGLDG